MQIIFNICLIEYQQICSVTHWRFHFDYLIVEYVINWNKIGGNQSNVLRGQLADC